MGSNEKQTSSNEEHFAYAMELVSSTSVTMVLATAIKLKLLEAIAKAGPHALLSAHEVASCLSITNQDAPNMLDRMLLLLASHSLITCTQRVDHGGRLVRVYGLAPAAKYFVPNEDGVSLSPLIELQQDKAFFESWFKLKDSVVEGGVPFNKVHGTHAFEYPETDSSFNTIFNNAMMNHTTIVMKEILKCYQGFESLKCLVDVGGGLGVSLNMIVLKYPAIKGINFDLPHVVRHAPLYSNVEHVEGDMFQEVPKGDAIFMKWILHDWSDDHCVKLLKNCYKALSDKGKVIIVETILPFLPDTSSSVKSSIQADVLMMTQNPGGKVRTEDELFALAKAAGFTKIKKECFACLSWVIEFYK